MVIANSKSPKGRGRPRETVPSGYLLLPPTFSLPSLEPGQLFPKCNRDRYIVALRVGQE